MEAHCPKESPVYCEQDTLSRGLCLPEGEDCNVRSDRVRDIPLLDINPLSAKYGYRDSPDLGKHCYYTNHTITLNYHQKYEHPESIPSDFSCLTYNIWGLAKNDTIKKLFRLRKPLLIETIEKLDADLLCLQEISSFAYEELKDLFATYPFASEIPYPHNASKKENRNRGVDVFFLSKYRPSDIYIYGLEGVLGYANALMVIVYPNLLIFNLYGQAGSKSSPGQEKKWLHYSRCRYDILESIHDLIDSQFKDFTKKGKQIIICGDFNFHFDGTLNDWPEMEMIHTLKKEGFRDSFREKYPDKDKHPGFTEDTDLNPMRWNQKLIEKFYRFDAILYRGPLAVKQSKVIGQEVAPLSKEDSEWFLSDVSEAYSMSQLATLESGLPINPSDHFGVLTTFGHRSKSRARSATRKRSRSLHKSTRRLRTA
jgi:exonuclease III